MALLGSGCVRCGQPYPPNGIKVLAQRDEIAFVQLICFNCQIQTLALVTGLDAAAAEGDTEPDGSSGEGGTAGRSLRRGAVGPISEDDVLEMHSFLDGYEGDLRTLLDPPREPGEGPSGTDGGAE